MNGSTFDDTLIALERMTDDTRLKVKRLGLPSPGTLLRVKHFAILSTIHSSVWSSRTVHHESGTLLLVVYVNTRPPEHPRGPLNDAVEIIVMGKGDTLYTTGTQAGHDVLLGYEVL